MKIKVEAIIDVDPAYGDFKDKDEIEWFNCILNDKKGTMLILWSNDVGDEIGSTFDFKFKLLDK